MPLGEVQQRKGCQAGAARQHPAAGLIWLGWGAEHVRRHTQGVCPHMALAALGAILGGMLDHAANIARSTRRTTWRGCFLLASQCTEYIFSHCDGLTACRSKCSKWDLTVTLSNGDMWGDTTGHLHSARRARVGGVGWEGWGGIGRHY